MIKKTFISFLIILSLVLSFSSCLGDSGPENNPKSTNNSTSANTEASEVVTTESSVTDPVIELKYPEMNLIIPEDNKVFDKEFAISILGLCASQDKDSQRFALENAGFEVIVQKNYEKDSEDRSHTCAYTIACGSDLKKESPRNVIIVCVRGTSAGEWYSNFDFAPSHSDDTKFAENFLMCAEDVMTELQPIIKDNPESEIIVCGHSRGAACANLLGYLLNENNVSDVYAYTFATPTTVRGDFDNSKYTNIFNIINPSDIVTYLPLASMGYYRIGTDIVLSGTETLTVKVKDIVDSLSTVASGISSYYNDKHSLSEKGLSDDGVTVASVMESVTSAIFSPGEKTSEALETLGKMSENSDFAPLVNLISEMNSEGSMMFILISAQHMPSTYMNMLGMLK